MNEIQWMSLALVGEIKGIWPQKLNSAAITLHGMDFPSTPLLSPPSLLLSEKDMVGWC